MIKVTELGYVGEKLKPKYCYGGTHNITTLSTTIVATNATINLPAPSSLSSKNFVITIIFIRNFLTFPYNGYSTIGDVTITAPNMTRSSNVPSDTSIDNILLFNYGNIVRLIGSVTHNNYYVIEVSGCTWL